MSNTDVNPNANPDMKPEAAAGGAVSRKALYLAVFVALLVGFVGGIGYSAFRSAAVPVATQPPPQGAAETAGPPLSAEELEKRAQADPDNARAWADLAHAFHDSGRIGDAIAAYTRALAVEPDDPDLRTDLGVMYYQDKNPALALFAFEQVLRQWPKHAKARFNKGVVLYQGLGRREAALEQWKTLLEHEPEMRTPEGRPLRELVRQLEEEGRAEPAAEEKTEKTP